VEEVTSAGYTDVVVLGMGGSSLAPEVFRRSRVGGSESSGLALHVLDTTEPLQVLAVEQRLDLDKTLFVVSSKSGGTIEPNSLFKHFYGLQPDGAHFIAITDPWTHMGDVATEHNFRRTFVNDPDIGGRYSALSYFGIVPAALAGIDVRAQLAGAITAQHASEGESGLFLGAALGALANAGRDKLAFIIDPPLESFGLWAEQLIAESTGKQGRGVLPIADEPLGSNYGDDRVFIHLRAGGDRPQLGDAPVLTVDFGGAADLSRLFFDFEFATAVLGWALGINPFDQPNVQEAKDNTNRVLAEGSGDVDDGELADLLDGLAAPNYVAIMGYLPYDDAVDEAVARLRAKLIEVHGVATTWGYGPRFLHSTGQYHKGGPPTGRFLQLVHDDETDADIPGEEYGFRTLIAAQADGDLQTLRSHGLPAVRVRLNAGDLAGSIDGITERI
ncbi:MAG: transaldolase / glucose-6-phosphate isomerase, partial [Solirubrobacteraceae bacterium]|nr:transaldolase / glucose-6-phosphate isomerase [Solirubrobacteraceae bacterium]